MAEEFVDQDCCELVAALQCGDVAVAGEAAARLARKKFQVKLQLDSMRKPPESLISVTICIEDRYTANYNVTVKVPPSTSFLDLSQMMYERFEFPLRVLRWFAKKDQRVDNLSKRLSTYHITDGTVIYLYLLPAKVVGVTRESALDDYRRNNYVAAPGISQERMTSAVQTAAGQTVDDNRSLLPHHEFSVLRLDSAVEDETFSRGLLTEDTLVDTTLPSMTRVGWTCPQCTFVNEPTRPGCQMCSETRPVTYSVPSGYLPSDGERRRIEQETVLFDQMEEERRANLDQLLTADQRSLITNADEFQCKICFDIIQPGDGVVLRDCLHMFCKTCLAGLIESATSATIHCPFSDDVYMCERELQEREIKALVSNEVYEKFLAIGVKEAESRDGRSFHCRTPDCIGWCIYEDNVNVFECPTCGKPNCLLCKVQHIGQDCQQYQAELRARAPIDAAARQTQKKIQKMLRKGDAMHCPTCDIIVMKKDGCDWIRCAMCKTEICWVTKGPRWGPLGNGDETGGCKCGVGGRLCSPKCQNCH